MDERTFTRIAQEYGRRLYAVAYRLLGNRADAEDAVQRALLNCFAARETYSPRWAVSTWLYRVLSNVCIDELRRRRPQTETAPSVRGRGRASRSAFDARGESARDVAERVDVSRALARVPHEARVLIALHYVDGLSYEELAKIRGISINTVKSQLARGKAILKAALEQGGHA